MKTFTKVSVLLIVLMAAGITLNAQTLQGPSSNAIRYSAGAESGFALGQFKNAYKWALGGSLQADIPVANHFFETINIGYLNYFGNNTGYPTATLQPIFICFQLKAASSISRPAAFIYRWKPGLTSR